MVKIALFALTIQELSLESVLLPFLPENLELPPLQVSLPSLTSFNLSDEYGGAMAFLLSHLALPECLEIDVEASDGTLSDQFAVARALVHARGLASWPVIHVEIMSNDDDFRFQMTEQRDGSDIPIQNEISLSLSQSGTDYDMADVLPAYTLLPFSLEGIRYTGAYFDHQNPVVFSHFGSQETILWLDLRLEFVAAFSLFCRTQNKKLRDITKIGFPTFDVVLDDQIMELALAAMGFHKLQEVFVDGTTDELDNFSRSDRELGRHYYAEIREWLIWRNILGLRLMALIFTEVAMPRSAMECFEGLVNELGFEDVEEISESSATYSNNWPMW